MCEKEERKTERDIDRQRQTEWGERECEREGREMGGGGFVLSV